jgi:hypothetical protein
MFRSLALLLLALPTVSRLDAQCELQKIHSNQGLWPVCDVEGDLAVARHDTAVQVLERTPHGWVVQQEIALPESRMGFWWGEADLDGDRLAVGCYDVDQEMVLVYERSAPGEPFEQTATLTPSFTSDLPMFGEHVALEGDVLAVGSSDQLIFVGKGSAFVFEHVGGAWSEVVAMHGFGVRGDGTSMGTDVAVEGGTVFLSEWGGGFPFGGPGGVHVLEKTGTGWTETQLLPVGGKLAAEGARLVDFYYGTLYVYELDAGVWAEVAAVDVEGSTRKVALSGGTVAITNPLSGPGSSDGFVSLVFESGGSWVAGPKLTPADVGPDADFGYLLALDGDVLLATSREEDDGGPAAIYAFSVAGPGCPSLIADVHEITAATGGAQTLSLEPGAALAGDLFVLAGSLSGFWPGTPFAGVTIPLNADVYLLYTLFHGGSPPLTAPVGLLDASGAATVRVALPADPNLAGLLAHHAFGVVDLGLSVVHVSNPVPLLVL